MMQSQLPHQPTLRQLLSSEALSEAQVVYGEDLLERPVVQVVASVVPPPRAGSLLVTRAEVLTSSREPLQLKDLSGVILIKPTTSDSTPSKLPSSSIGTALPNPVGASLAPINTDVAITRIVKMCTQSSTPVIVMPGFGDPGQVADDVRMAFLRELKLLNARMHSNFLSVLLEDGLEGLVEDMSSRLNRPVAVESVDFKVLASRNMGGTPTNQQRTLADETHAAIQRAIQERRKGLSSILSPVKVGRRLVLPVCLSDTVVGYLAVMVRPNDDLEPITEIMQAAGVAVMVEFGQRRKDGSVFAVTQKSLLKDLLAGRGLSASDQERLERHYGFDLCDSILVLAVQAPDAPQFARFNWTDEKFTTTEVEGTHIFLLPHRDQSELTWQQEARELINRIREATESGAELKLQVGAARMVGTLLDLPHAYREARQALIIGSMIHGDNEFLIGYGDLGIKRLLYLMIDHPEFDRFYEETLEPLEAYDAEWESELVPSLRVYLQEGANLNSAARALFIHRHTLRYRLEQIADILKVDIDSQEVLLNLQIAFLIGDLKGQSKGKIRS